MEGTRRRCPKSRVVTESKEGSVQQASFNRVIEEHLELQRRNRSLELSMPISQYRDSVEVERTDLALASRGAATEILEVDPPTETLLKPGTPPWEDPDSWWNADEASIGWQR